MASLNGITVKGLKSTEGPEGIVWTGKLYLNDVMIGVWSNDYYGGPDHFELLPGYDEEKLKEQIYGKYPGCYLISADIFMGRLVDLTIEGQLFCKAVGNSGGLLLSINDGYHGIHIELPREYGGLSDEEILKKEAELIYNSRKCCFCKAKGESIKLKFTEKQRNFVWAALSCLMQFGRIRGWKN